MRIVTGGLGFIGSHLIKRLNDYGYDDVVIVDNVHKPAKNIEGCKIKDIVDMNRFYDLISKDKFKGKPEIIFHQGACTNTMIDDDFVMMDYNILPSKRLLDYVCRYNIPFIYASSAAVYGNNHNSKENIENEDPLNAYARSKKSFDDEVRFTIPISSNGIIGLRYFNVYGENETFKLNMTSVVRQFIHQIKKDKVVRLFKGTDGYADGEQYRDFIYVRDVIDVIMHFFNTLSWKKEGKNFSGIYNVGTGHGTTFNMVAETIIDILGYGKIEYIDFPEELVGKYQSNTKAHISKLNLKADFEGQITPIEDGIKEVINNVYR